MQSKEIDFVAMKNGRKTYIQVNDNITNQETFNREVAPLLSINDAYPKILIARTKNNIIDFNGVEIIDIARWLLDE